MGIDITPTFVLNGKKKLSVRPPSSERNKTRTGHERETKQGQDTPTSKHECFHHPKKLP